MINTGFFRRHLSIHICELAKFSDSNLPKLPPNANILARLKRSFQKLILVSEKHPLTRFLLRSRAAIAFDKRRHGRSSYWWIIHPCSLLRFFWDLLMIITYLYIFVMVPHILTFHRIAKNSSVESWTIVYPAYVICIIDIIFNFITGFVSHDGHEIFLDPELIAWHYVRRYFFIDLISSIPYTWFYKERILPPGPNSNSVFLVLEFLPILKLFRLGTLYQYLRQLNITFGSSHAQEMIIWLIILTSLIFHWSSCLFYLFPYIVMHIIGDNIENSGAYLIQTELYKKSDWMIYLKCFHIGLSNVIGFSFIEFQSFGTLDKINHCMLLLFGKGYMIYTIVIILQLVESLAEPELKYQEIIYGVKNYMQEKELPKHLRDKLLAYYQYRYQGNFFKEDAISNTLSSQSVEARMMESSIKTVIFIPIYFLDHLNQEIIIHSSRGLLESATILRNLPPIVLGNLITTLKPVIYMENDIIYKCHNEGDCMYFIASGTVALITFWGKEICHLEDGEHFGAEVLINSQNRRTETALSLEVCELLSFDRRDFKRLVARHSELYNRIQKDTIDKFKLVEELEKKHRESEREKSIPRTEFLDDQRPIY